LISVPEHEKTVGCTDEDVVMKHREVQAAEPPGEDVEEEGDASSSWFLNGKSSMTQCCGLKRRSAMAASGDGLATAEHQLEQTALMFMYASPPPVVERTQSAMPWRNSGRSSAQSAVIDR
jgi:hypothetical protein